MMNVLERIKTFDFSKKLFFKLSPAIVKHGYWENSCMSDLNAEDELIKLAEIGERMQWVNVTDRLPESNVLVLLFLNDGEHTTITTGKIYLSDDVKYNGEFCVGFDQVMPDFIKREVVTHWMKLPQPPI